MPNWCFCDLTIEGDKQQIEKFANDFYSEEEKCFSMEQLMPTPEILINPKNNIRNSVDMESEYRNNCSNFSNVTRLKDLDNINNKETICLYGNIIKNTDDLITLSFDDESVQINTSITKRKPTEFYDFEKYVLLATKHDNVFYADIIINASAMKAQVIMPDTLFRYEKEEINNDIKMAKALIEVYKNSNINYENTISLLNEDEVIEVPEDISLLLQIFLHATTLKGYIDWYDWRIRNYGTKWDMDCYDKDNREEYVKNFLKYNATSYATAWSPNENFFLLISRKYPELTFHLEFTEEGMGFLGTTVISNGIITNESYMDINNNKESYYKELVERNGEEIIDDLIEGIMSDEDYFLLEDLFDLTEEQKDRASEVLEEL